MGHCGLGDLHMTNKTNKLSSTLVNGCGKLVLDYESVNETFFSSLHHRLLLVD
jgi:hypothetical protein